MRRVCLAALSALFFVLVLLPFHRSFVAATDVSEGERLAMHSKPSVVRIVDGVGGNYIYSPPGNQAREYNVSYIGLGSGSFINSNGYIATNAHVVSTFHDGEDKAKEALFGQLVNSIARDLGRDPRSFTRDNLTFIYQHSYLRSMKWYHVVVIPDGSVYEFEIKQYGAPTGEGKDVAILKIEVKNAPTLLLGDSDKMQLQDHITVIGYPGAADTFNTGTLDSKSQLEASITDGKLSARKRSSAGAPILQISAPATHGNSGGPVLTDKNEVVGLLTFRGDTVNGQEVSGFDFVVPSSTVMEFVKAAGVTNELGHADRLYREGLELYWTQQYSKAIPKLEEVKRLFPQHSEVEHLIQESQQGIAEGKDKSGVSMWAWLLGGLALIFFVIAILIVALILFFILRRRSKGASARAATASKPLPAPVAYSPAPSPGKAPAAPPMPPPPAVSAADQARTVDLSRTLAITADGDTAPINHGSIKFVSGALSGQHFEIKAEGCSVGRDVTLSQIVIADPRISKRHVWIGVREGRVAISDQGSRNGTFLNDPKSARVTEAFLSPGDTVILGESDVARFEYHR